MSGRSLRLAVVVLALAGTVPVAAAVAAGPGTFTRITTPSHTRLITVSSSGPHTFLTIAGTTSNDVTTVDVDCIFNRPQDPAGPQPATLASDVPVAGGGFSVQIDLSTGSVTPNCRLRAVPSEVDVSNAYLGSYTGPLLYVNTLARTTDTGGTPYAFGAIGEQGDGIGEISDAGGCGAELLTTIQRPTMTLYGSPNPVACLFALPAENQTPSGTSTASSVKVDGHNAYLPSAVQNYLISNSGRGISTITQPKLTSTFHAASNGDVTVTESAPLVRCSVDDTYPPTSGSCPAVVKTGVTFRRTTNIFRGAHQIRMRDSFVSTNSHSHAISLQYQNRTPPPGTGATGYIFPGHGSTFATATPGQVVGHLGATAGTVLARSDIYAASDDVVADTLGFTWSRAPAKMVFSHGSANQFATPYSLTVPTTGAANLGFAVSERVATKDTKALAGVAVGEMVTVPTIGSPANGATVHGHSTKVKGTVTAGANGLPTSVTVNGHTAHLTAVSATKKAYSVTFDESFAKHRITVTAHDVAGNTRSKSITVTNRP